MLYRGYAPLIQKQLQHHAQLLENSILQTRISGNKSQEHGTYGLY